MNPDLTAICPFYEHEAKLSVTCEGLSLDEAVNTQIRFADKPAKADWMRKYCASYQYGRCPYARILDGKYQ